MRRAAVVGGGVCGVTAAKCLLEEGIEPVVFEQNSRLGGIWTFDEALPDGGGPAYRSLHTNTIRAITAYSDFPLPEDLPEFPGRADIERYLNAYADHFGVRECVRFRTRVEAVTPLADDRWAVCTAGSASPEIFDAVLVCSGVFRMPLQPRLPGAETFTGTLLHSRSYTAPEPFAGQTVVVVGAGSSGNDIAIELSQVARQVILSARSADWSAVLRRPVQSTKPNRMQQVRQAARRLSTRLRRHTALVRQKAGRGHEVAPDAPFELGTAPLSLKPALFERISAGTVSPKPQITRIAGDCVAFGDGSQVRADTIIAATGYAVEFPFLDPGIVPVSAEGLPLYRLVFPPDYPTLAFLGMFRVTGPVPPVAEMQARWVAQVLRGGVHLPAPDAMRASIGARMALIARTGGNPFRLDFEAYLDLLAAEIGVLPRLWRHPRLWPALLTGPPVSARYRLDGRGRWCGAARVILAANRPKSTR